MRRGDVTRRTAAHTAARTCVDGTTGARTARSAALGRCDDSLAARRSLGVAGVGSARAGPAVKLVSRSATSTAAPLTVTPWRSSLERPTLGARGSWVIDPIARARSVALSPFSGPAKGRSVPCQQGFSGVLGQRRWEVPSLPSGCAVILAS